MAVSPAMMPAVDTWLVRPNPRPDAAVRLVCLPYAGAGVAPYVPWSRLIHSVEVAAVRFPGRETRLREEPYRRLSPLVDDLADGLAGYLDRPFALFGHSMGAVVAFELAERLRGVYGLEPLLLAVSGRRAPHLPDLDPPLSELADDAFLAEVQRRYDGVPQAVLDNPELLEIVLPTLRADIEALEARRHWPQPPLAMPISAFAGRDDARVPEADLAAWAVHTTATFRMRRYPGGHFFFHGRPRLVLDAVVADLGVDR